MLFEGHLVHYLYFMLDQSSFAQVWVPVGKQVFPSEQQLSGLLLAGVGHIPLVPLTGLNVLAGVAHSQAIWP